MKSYNELQVNILEQTSDKSVVFTFGRFQPPTSGHQLLINKVIKEARKRRAEHRIYPSHSHDAKQNPLSHKDKVLYMRKLFPKANIIDDKKATNPFKVLASLSKEGYNNIYFMVGGDRVSEFKKVMKKHVGKDGYDFNTFEVISAGERDPDAEGVVGMSGSKMRKAAKEKEFESFLKGVPDKTPKRVSLGLFKAIRKGMGLKEEYISEQTFNVRLSDTDETRARGLMHETHLNDGDGMFFVFEEEDYHGIWMKNTHIPLDCVWINESGTVVDIKRLHPHNLDTRYPANPAKYVLELNAGTFDGVIGDILQLDEVQTKFKVGDKVKYKGKVGTITKVGSGGTQWPGLVIYLKMKDGKKVSTMAKDLIKESYLYEADNTASVAKQLKQAVKKYTKGKVTVRSKGGKTRFIMLSADNIDNKLRKMMLDVAYPKANVRGGDLKNISYGNISDKIISASVDHWVKALGLKESYLFESHLLGKTVIVAGKKGVVTKFLGDDFGEMYQVKLEDGTVITSPAIEMESIDESFENMLTELSIEARRKMSRAAKRTSKRRAAKRKIKARRMKGGAEMQIKARKSALMGFKKKMLKGKSWSTLGHAEKENIARRMKKKYSPARIAKVAQKLLPGLRKSERERVAALRGGGDKNEQVEYLTEPQALENLVKKLKSKNPSWSDSKAFAIATAQLQKSGVLKKGTHDLEERNYKLEYANYQGKPEQIERRSSRNKARRAMEKEGKVCKGDGLDVDHKDRNPLNNDTKNLQAVDAGENRSFDRTDESKFYQGKRKALEDGTNRARSMYQQVTPGQYHWFDDPDIKKFN